MAKDIEQLSLAEVRRKVETILDILIEVDNGTSREDIYDCVDELFNIRDNFLDNLDK